jgi:N-acetylneuraminate synthase/N,N'-diacetyllegionaminate synthase
MGDRHCFVIAEIGVNHNGDVDLARRLIDVAADCGADAAKFQTFRAEDLIVEGTEAVEYQKKDNADLKQYDLLKKLELSQEAHRALVEHCKTRGIEFMSTGFDEKSLRFLIELGIRRIKIPSGEITNTPLLEVAAAARLPIIVSTGMATLEEVRASVDTIRASWTSLCHEGDLIVLHCTSAYPTDLSDVNLSAMATLARELGEPVGYSDHTEGTLVSALAVAAGARMIEKHITLDKSMEGPDHAASLEPSELAQMIREVRQVESILGNGVKAPVASEIETRALVRKGLKFARALPKGHVLGRGDLVALRPETGLAPSRLKELLGKTLSGAVAAQEPVASEHLVDD